MGSVLQRISRRGSDGANSSSHTQLPPYSTSPHSISQSSPSRQQENQSTSGVENTAGFMQQGNHGFAFTAEQSSALSLPHGIKQEVLSLNPEQRARMEHHKAMALARRKEKLEQQKEELLLNQLTPGQSTPSSQQYNPIQSTLSSQQDNHLQSTQSPHRANYTVFVSARSAPSSQQGVFCNSALGLADRHALPLQQDIYGASTLASIHSAQYLQHGSPELHQDMYSSSTLTSTHNPQSSQHTALVSVQSSLPLQQNNQGLLAPTSVQNPLSLQQGSHASLDVDSVHSCLSLQQTENGGFLVNSPHGSLTLQHDDHVSSSLTLEQRARMACEREKALARRQKQNHHPSETRTSQCTIADGSTNFVSQRSHKHGGSSHVPVELSFSTQKQEDGGFYLTPAQRAHIARQKEAAIARRKQRLQCFQEHLATSSFTNNFVTPSQSSSQNETHTFSQQPQDSYRGASSNYLQHLHHSGSSLTSVQSLASSQQDTYSASSLTQEQRVHVAQQKEMAIARGNASLRHQQQEHHHHTHPTSIECLASSQHDTYSGSSLTQEQRARMAHQKEMAIARCNARLRQQQQDEHQNMCHKPLYSKQGTAPVCTESQNFATSLLTKCMVDCSQSASNNQCGAPILSERQVSMHEGNMGSISLTPQQKVHMVSQKERALAKRTMILEQRQLQHHVNKPSERKKGFLQVSSPCSPVPRAVSCEYFSAEYYDSLASDCCHINSQESQNIQK